MKKKIIAAILLISCLINIKERSFAQCDIATNGLSLSASPIFVGGTSNFKFSVYNGGTDEACIYAIGSIKVELIFPASGYVFENFVSPAGALSAVGPYFNWTYDATNHKVVGVNTLAIPYNEGEVDVTIAVKGTAASSGHTVLQLTAINGTNTTTLNDNAPATLVVQAALPVRLISFNGKSTEKGNELTWKTSSEQNFSHYEVERSADARQGSANYTFKMIGKVNGSKSNTKENLTYNFLDENTATGMVPGANQASVNIPAAYYRLKMVDLDGSFEYSKVIFIENKGEKSTVGYFYPNPAFGNEVTINITSESTKVWTITSYNLSGKVMNTETRQLNRGENKLKFGLKVDESDISIFRFESTDGVQFRKLNR